MLFAAADPTADLGAFAGFITTIMDALGEFGVAVLVAAENLFPPIPSEAILPLAGFAASQGSLDLVAVILWATVGSVVGAIALYALGAWLGRERFIRLAARVPLISVNDIERTEQWFVRHGRKTVLLGRLVPIFRSLISIPAGIERMRMIVFVPLTTLGSLVWNTVLVLAGYALGENYGIVEEYVGAFQWVVIVVVVALVAAFVVWKVRRARRAHD
ncbi:DedA family protein [Pseudoclavibacter sp. 13-3]|uniref:DedA family protein n=1 Tax=Pseudoclavibacter sp. 13-3 TaxID=2901228 RepID=UPI001E4F9917|nr:DedA family protein [Pseudoclavibacter sp. 13-3]MCD7102348.1 DedA family protein [Pseudoclavibacter sp. 13-3]